MKAEKQQCTSSAHLSSIRPATSVERHTEVLPSVKPLSIMSLRSLNYEEEKEICRAFQRLRRPPTERESTSAKYFDVVEIPGRGRGCKALKEIPRGTKILEERLLFRVRNIQKDANKLSGINKADLMSKVYRLYQPLKDQFMALSSLQQQHNNALDQASDIWDTNNFQLTPYDDNNLSE